MRFNWCFLFLCFSLTAKSQWKSANNGMPYGASTRIANANSQGVFAMVEEELFISGNKGNSWQSKGSFDYSTSISSNENTVVLGSAKEFFFSNDNGSNWQKVGTFDDYISSVGISPQGIFYVSTSKSVFRSLDKGQTWLPVNNGLPNGIKFKKINFAKDYMGEWIYGYTANNFLYRSNDNGLTWSNGTHLDAVVSQFSSSGEKILMATQWGLLGTANGGPLYQLSPTYPANPVAMEVGTNLMCLLTQSGELFISANDGANWLSRKPTEFYGQFFYSLALNGSSIFVGTVNGIYRSDDLGMTWFTANKGISRLQVHNFSYDGISLVAATNKGVMASSDLGESWENISANIQNKRIQSVVHHNGQIYAAATTNWSISGGNSTPGGIFVLEKSASWRQIQLTPNSTEVIGIYKDGIDLFACTNQGLFRSTDGGLSWVQLLNAPVSAVGAKGDSIIVQISGFAQEPPYPIMKLSTDGGNTWTFSNLNGAASSFLFIGSEIWAIKGRVFSTSDLGYSWNSRPPFSFPVNTVRQKGDLLLLGSTEFGVVWSKNDEMKSFRSNEGLPFKGATTPITDIYVAGDNVFVGIGSSGVWKRSLAELISSSDLITGVKEHDPVTANIFPNPAKDKVTIMWDKKNEPVEIVMSDALGRIISHLSVPNGGNSVELSLSSFEPGVYIIKVGNHALRILKL